MKNWRYLISLCLVLVVVFAAMPAHVSAQGTRIAAGLGIGAAPDYEGSDNMEAVPLPFFSVTWENHMAINLAGNKGKINLIPSPMWKGGIVGEFIGERDDVDSDAVDNMETVDSSLMLGGFFGFEIDRWSASIEAMADVSDSSDGTIVRVLGGYKIPLDAWVIGLEAFSTWADDDYMETYFGVSTRDANRSGLSTYDADSGFKDIGLNVTVNYSPWRHWSIMGLAGFKRMLGDAEDSPVVDDEGDENQFVGGIFLIYRF